MSTNKVMSDAEMKLIDDLTVSLEPIYLQSETPDKL